MDWFDRILIWKLRVFSKLLRVSKLGAGETWPGELALAIRPTIAGRLFSSYKKGIILIAGTNGKTTTTLLVTTMLKNAGFSVTHNASGANLLNGIVSAMIRYGFADYGVFEVDENSLSIVLRHVKPKAIVLLNLFRDQLDRYGEVDVIIEKWQKVFDSGDQHIKPYQMIINADDPGVATLGGSNATFFGVHDKTKFLKTSEHATDSTFCPNCGARLVYDGVYYSHIGIWRCVTCGLARPKLDITQSPAVLPGLYNTYNTLAAIAVGKVLGVRADFSGFSAAFGRQEEIVVGGTIYKLFLSKNPTGFNASIRTALELGAKEMIFVLNDRIPDGRDVSWIWDVDFETIPKQVKITASGDRVYDLAIRLKYAGLDARVEPDLPKAFGGKQVFILATYSAMLEVRKILTGHKIL